MKSLTLAITLFMLSAPAFAGRDSGGAYPQGGPAPACDAAERCREGCNSKFPDDDEAFNICIDKCNSRHCGSSFESLVQTALDKPGFTACKIRCHNLHEEDEKAYKQCVRENCTDNR